MTIDPTYHDNKQLSLFTLYGACLPATHGHLIDVCFSRSLDVHVDRVHKRLQQCLADAKNIKFLVQKARSRYEL